MFTSESVMNLYRKGLGLLLVVALLLSYGVPGSAAAQANDTVQVKELNFVFLPGIGGSPCSLQRLSDWITKRLSSYSYLYELSNPGIKVKVNILSRCYPGYCDIATWANNLADDINKNFKDKDNLILIGHSMGGKTALYAVAKNIGGLADKVSTVVTINSPIKSLVGYYAPGGAPVLNYCITGLLGSNEGVCTSVTNYDSSSDGKWVGTNRHWLAFISAENAPLSSQFDHSGVDPWPRDMDDGVVPISVQYSDGADVIYYGEHGHSDFGIIDDVAAFIADQTVRYLFGYSVDCCVFFQNSTIYHSADWLLGKDHWDEVVGEQIAVSGILRHTNESFTQWKQWEDVVGEIIPDAQRSSCLLNQLSFKLTTSIKEARWVTADKPDDCRLYLRVGAAPRSTVQVNWVIYRSPLLPENTRRGYYEVKITDGTPLVAVTRVDWLSKDTRDLRLRVWSQADSPFRWFTAEWRVYYYDSRQKRIIDEIPTEISPSGS